MSPQDVMEFAKENNVEMVDFRFIDWPGVWQHFTVPVHHLSLESFTDGFGFDGSSIRGWQKINASDMLVIPDATTAQMDPFFEVPTLVLICDIYDPILNQPYTRDPRYIAKKAVNYLGTTGIADTAFFGPEAEFFVFNSVRYQNGPQIAYAELDSMEGHWNSGRDEQPNLGHKPRFKEGYFPVPPVDTLQDIRTQMVQVMKQVGIDVECHHHEVATAGQCEIDMKYDRMVKMADQVMWYKYIVKNVAFQNNMTATFMPKPLYKDNGSGMHTHQSLWKGNVPLFAGDGYNGFSDLGLYYIGGIIKHAKAIAAFTNPTTNSYKRLVPGYEAPVNMAYSARNRSAALRLPVVKSPKAKRVEVRFPDPSCNPYLSFSVMLMAGLDGIQNKIHPGEPLDKDIYSLSKEELRNVPSAPENLNEALTALEKDHEFLLKGDVFTPDAIEMWIEYKRENEHKVVSQRPHPMEFELYYDI